MPQDWLEGQGLLYPDNEFRRRIKFENPFCIFRLGVSNLPDLTVAG